MQWAEHLYLSEKAAAKKDRIIKKANRGIGMVSIYLIALARIRRICLTSSMRLT